MGVMTAGFAMWYVGIVVGIEMVVVNTTVPHVSVASVQLLLVVVVLVLVCYGMRILRSLVLRLVY